MGLFVGLSGLAFLFLFLFLAFIVIRGEENDL